MPEYEWKTTFWTDFSIADLCGKKAIQDTFNRAFKEWKDNYIYLTDLVVALNWKIWQWYGKNDEYAKLYNDLWEKADLYAGENLEGDEATYFYSRTD